MPEDWTKITRAWLPDPRTILMQTELMVSWRADVLHVPLPPPLAILCLLPASPCSPTLVFVFNQQRPLMAWPCTRSTPPTDHSSDRLYLYVLHFSSMLSVFSFLFAACLLLVFYLLYSDALWWPCLVSQHSSDSPLVWQSLSLSPSCLLCCLSSVFCLLPVSLWSSTSHICT